MAEQKPKQEFDINYKIIQIGDAKVGKTSYLCRFTKNIIPTSTLPTIGIDYATKIVVLQNGVAVKGQIWDTSGSEKYKSITTAHYKKSHGALLFFDLTEDSSFKNAESWLKELREHADASECVTMLIGNKYDLVQECPENRKILKEDIDKFCKNNNMIYFETSAVTGYQVRESFETLIERIYESDKNKNIPVQRGSIQSIIKITTQPSKESPAEDEGCCKL